MLWSCAVFPQSELFLLTYMPHGIISHTRQQTQRTDRMITLRFVFPGGQLELSLTDKAATPGPVIEVRGVDVAPERPGIVKAIRAQVLPFRKAS